MARQEPAIIGGRTIPGTRPAGKRPIAVSRPLPARIVIDRRSRPCPYLCLTPYAIAKKGAVIELSDGSIWEVRHRNRRMVKKWKPEDVIIVETGSFLSWSNYRLVNCTRGETADVELAGADRLGSHSHWIVELNAGQGYLRLEDGALWRLSAGELARWRVNDDVIVGISKDPLADQYQQILINPRAKSRLVASFEF